MQNLTFYVARIVSCWRRPELQNAIVMNWTSSKKRYLRVFYYSVKFIIIIYNELIVIIVMV